jgi:hypothetical protein
VLAVSLAVALTSRVADRNLARAVSVAGAPAYYAIITRNLGWHIQVLATATGKVVAQYVPDPAGAVPVDLATLDDRTFYAEYDVGRQIWIYTFRISDDGSATPMMRVKGAIVNGQAGMWGLQSLAVAPGASRLALTFSATGSGLPDSIAVIDLRTGTRTIRIPPPPAGMTFSIPSLTWVDGGRSVVFLLQRCTATKPGPFYQAYPPCDGDGIANAKLLASQMWSLKVPGDRFLGPLQPLPRASSALPDPAIIQAIPSPDGKIITAVVLLRGAHLEIVRISSADGAILSVLYQQSIGTAVRSLPIQGYFGADSSGRYLVYSPGNLRMVLGPSSLERLHRIAPHVWGGLPAVW